jgi:protease-4
MNNNDRWVEDDRDYAYDSGWERDVISTLALDSLKEQRRARRWGIFFKLLGFGYVAVALLLAFRNNLFDFNLSEPEKHTAIVDVAGAIGAGEQASADRIVAGVKAAFADENTAGVILRINSPGGSPVQSGRVFDEVKRMREMHPEVPLYAVIEDLCASGGYYVAAAADRIYADKASLVGSIGVRSGGFGFVDTMSKLGVERRLITAGENKAFLDPFSPLKSDEVAHMESLLEEIHLQFKAVVKEGRGDALADDSEIFSGLIWTGEQAVANGLVDEIGSEMTVAREVFKAEKLVNFTPQDGLLSQIAGNIGVKLSGQLANSILVPEMR